MPAAFDYHEATSHRRDRLSDRMLDWANQPDVFKVYPEGVATTMALPQAGMATAPSLPLALRGVEPAKPSLAGLATVLALGAGLTAMRRQGGMTWSFRSWASAGALYPCETYLALGGAWEGEGLAPGLYHHAPEAHALRLLRHGDAMGVAAAACGLPEGPASAGPGRLAGVLCLTTVFHRSAWKYGERAYRYVLLDAGHLAESLLLSLRLHGFSAMWAMDFQDAAMNALLCLDAEREACVLALPFFQETAPERVGGAAPAAPGPLEEPLDRETLRRASRCAPEERTWPAILAAHQAGSIAARFVGRGAEPPETPERGEAERGEAERGEAERGKAAAAGLSLGEATAAFAGRLWPSLPRVMATRRSRRNFSKDPVPLQTFHAFCHLLCERTRQDRGARALHTLLLWQRVEGLRDGLGTLDREARTLLPRDNPPSPASLAHVCLDQGWVGLAAAVVAMWVDLPALEAGQGERGAWGARGYRAVQLAAGRLGQRVYLAATSLGWGACGVGAYYDDEAARLLGLPAGGRALYFVAAGPVLGGVAPVQTEGRTSV